MKRFKGIEELKSEKQALKRKVQEEHEQLLNAEQEFIWWQNKVKRMELDLWSLKERVRRKGIDMKYID